VEVLDHFPALVLVRDHGYLVHVSAELLTVSPDVQNKGPSVLRKKQRGPGPSWVNAQPWKGHG
jgi:hypothetical protein